MGTSTTVKVVSVNLSKENQQQIREIIEEQLDLVNSKMSTYLESSELSRFNQSRETSPFPLSPETLSVFEQARRIGEASGGAFDITVGPLVNAWGFGPSKLPPVQLSEADITRLRKHTGWDKIAIDAASSSVRKFDPEVYCDLSAIAKGYAVDLVSETLSAAGYVEHMVEVGGEVRARGRNQSGEPWRSAIERPVENTSIVERIVSLKDLSLATSGDYRNYYEKDGMKLSHTIDPRTGRPVNHRLASVSVIDRSCMRADGFATAVMALGEIEGYALAEREQLAALLIVRDGKGGFTEKPTPRFEKLVATRELSPNATTGQGETAPQ
jgi:thiamine biosynthesis lipoprotein